MAVTQANTYPGAGILTENIVTLFDWLKPQYWNQVAARYGYQFDGIYQTLRAMNREEPVAADEWNAYEENRYQRVINVLSVDDTTPGAGVAVVCTLATTDHEASGTVSFPRVGDMVLSAAEVPALITAKSTAVASAHTITIEPADILDDLGDLTGDVLIIFSGGYAAGMGQPDSTFVGMTKRTFHAQIIKESVGQEGTQFVNEKWVKAVDDGRSVNGWYNPGLMRAEYFLNRKIDGAFTWGKENTNALTQTTARGNTNDVKMTKGMVPWISELGKEMTITAGAFDMADLDEVTLYQKQQGTTTNMSMFWCGPELAIDVRNAAQAFIDGNGTDYTKVLATLFGGNKELAMSVNFTVLGMGDTTYLLKPVPAWSDPMTYSATGFDMPKYGILCGLDSYKDPKSGIIMPNQAIRYRAMDGYSRRFEVWNVSGAGGSAYKPYVTDVDEAMLYLRAHLGVQLLKANRGVIMRP